MMSALLILAFITASAFALYWSGNQAHRRSRFYSEAQTEIRQTLRQMTRVIRSAEAVVNPGTMGTLSGLASNASQIVVRLPQPSGAPIECRYYVSNGVLYQQRSLDTAPGTALLRGVTGLTFNYVRTLAGTRTSVDGAPASATEVQIGIRARRGSVTTGLTGYVAMRNALTGG
jgi:hypothetical protein